MLFVWVSCSSFVLFSLLFVPNGIFPRALSIILRTQSPCGKLGNKMQISISLANCGFLESECQWIFCAVLPQH